jgi:hypothetical protein
VIEKSPLTNVIEKWTKHGGDLDDILSSISYSPVKSKTEAEAICAAIDALSADPARVVKVLIGSPLHTLAAFFQHVENEESFDVFKQEGLPRLRSWVRNHLDGQDDRMEVIMFLLKILAMYRQYDDVDLIAEAARRQINADSYMWSIILKQFDAEHPFSGEMIDRLRDPLPTGFISVAYLDMANSLAIAGKTERHPFDSEAGRKQLEVWLSDTNEENFSYAHSATAALPFIDQSLREGLLQIAVSHPDASVRMESAWAQAKFGDPSGLNRLSELCIDPRYSYIAQQYLEELGHSDKIPERARQTDFQAVAEMANWLAHPNEFGCPPDEIELYDTRDLFWPPTNDKRQLWLIKYTYNDEEEGEPDRGIGMVGSVTFTLFGEATADLSPEDIYGLHCCWELEMNEDSRAPKKRSAKAGRRILSRKNADF